MACRPVTPPAPALFSTTNCCPSLFVKCSEKMRAITSVLPPAANGTMTTTGFDGHLSCANRAPAIKPSVTAAGASLAKIRSRIFPLPLSSNDAWRRSPFMSTLLSPSARGGGLGTRSLGRRFVFMIRNFRYLFVQLSISCPSKRVVICWRRDPLRRRFILRAVERIQKRDISSLSAKLAQTVSAEAPARPLWSPSRWSESAARHANPSCPGDQTGRGRHREGLYRVTPPGPSEDGSGPSTPVRGRDGEQCFDCPSSRRAKR